MQKSSEYSEVITKTRLVGGLVVIEAGEGTKQ